jgi:hypothetical protein
MSKLIILKDFAYQFACMVLIINLFRNGEDDIPIKFLEKFMQETRLFSHYGNAQNLCENINDHASNDRDKRIFLSLKTAPGLFLRNNQLVAKLLGEGNPQIVEQIITSPEFAYPGISVFLSSNEILTSHLRDLIVDNGTDKLLTIFASCLVARLEACKGEQYGNAIRLLFEKAFLEKPGAKKLFKSLQPEEVYFLAKQATPSSLRYLFDQSLIPEEFGKKIILGSALGVSACIESLTSPEINNFYEQYLKIKVPPAGHLRDYDFLIANLASTRKLTLDIFKAISQEDTYFEVAKYFNNYSHDFVSLNNSEVTVVSRQSGESVELASHKVELTNLYIAGVCTDLRKRLDTVPGTLSKNVSSYLSSLNFGECYFELASSVYDILKQAGASDSLAFATLCDVEKIWFNDDPKQRFEIVDPPSNYASGTPSIVSSLAEINLSVRMN